MKHEEHLRDPIALLLERELGKLARSIDEELFLNPADDRDVELRFGKVVVRAETRDIAFLRLASALLDVERYRRALLDAIGPRLSEELAEAI